MSHNACIVTFWLAVLSTAAGFFPNTLTKLASWGSSTHREITERALRQTANELITAHCSFYPDPAKTLNSPSFKEALEQFLDAVARPDLEEPYKHMPEAHFDNEAFDGSNDRIIKFRQTIVSNVKMLCMVSAREITGHVFHALQDFYSHSNWIEMGKRTPYEAIGQKRIPADERATATQATCIDCQERTGTCHNNIRYEIIENYLLTTGYTSSFGASKPPGKCSHGGLLDKTRKQSPVGGINKDSVSKWFSPHGYLHAEYQANQYG